jgi:hypothetical protein
VNQSFRCIRDLTNPAFPAGTTTRSGSPFQSSVQQSVVNGPTIWLRARWTSSDKAGGCGAIDLKQGRCPYGLPAWARTTSPWRGR